MNSDPDTDPVLAALSRLGDDHEPNMAALRRRIDRRSPPAAAARRNARSVILPAAAVLLVGGGVALVASIGGSGSDHAAPLPPTSVSVPKISPLSVSPAPTPSGTASGSPGPGAANPTGRAPTGAPSPAGRPAQGRRSASAEITAVSGSSAANVQLGTPSMLDWLAVGARSDLTIVRAKSAAAAPVLGFDQPPGVTAVPGPFQISWTGGVPEQSHTAAGTWLCRTGTAGLSVSLAPSPHPRTVMLAAGASDLAATVQVTGGAVLAPTSLGDVSALPRAVVITVHLPPTTGTSVIHLGGTATASGDRAQVFLSAVAVVAG